MPEAYTDHISTLVPDPTGIGRSTPTWSTVLSSMAMNGAWAETAIQ
jgi:hypothetical protein